MWSVDTVKTFCINLDRRPERWAAVIDMPVTKRLPNFQRWSATDGKTLDFVQDKRISTIARYNIKNNTRRSHDMLESIGGVGCALSHIRLWQKLVDSDDEVYLITEDDFVATVDQWETVRQLFFKTPFLADTSRWDIWTIGCLDCNEKIMVFPDKAQRDADRAASRWLRCAQFTGTQSYFITRAAAQKLLVDALPIQHHIDWYITLHAATKPFVIIHNRNANFKQRGALSDINMKTCEICNIADDVKSSHYVFRMDNANATILAVLAVAFVVSMAVARRK